MNSITQITRHSTTNRVIWVLIFLIPALFIWQGGDLTDTGYNVTVYYFFFERLHDGVTDSLIFLTELIGGIWFKVFPNLGVLGIKILAIIFLYSSVFLVYRILKSVYPKDRMIPFFLLCGVVFCVRCFPIIFNYDLLTAFFLLLIIYLFRKGNKSLNFNKLFLAGIISGALTLCRFPNIFILILFPVVLIICQNFKLIQPSFSKLFKYLFIYFLGFLIFCAITWFCFILLDWDQIYIQNLINFKNLVSENSESYNLSYVINKYALDFFYFCLYFAATYLSYFMLKWLNSTKKSNIWFLILFLILVVFSLYPFVFNYNNSIKYLVPTICVIGFLGKKISTLSKWIGCLIVCFCAIQIAGSNTGIFLKVGLLMLLALPLALLNLKNSTDSFRIKSSSIFSIYSLIFSTFIYLVFIYGIGQSPLIRLKATHQIQIKSHHGIYTTKDHAQKITEIVSSIDSVKGNHKKMFVYGHQPMLYYATNLQPVVKEFWLVGNNLTSPEKLFNEISQKSEKPLFLDTKEPIFDQNSTSAKNKFLKENQYKLVKSLEHYDIWISIKNE